MTDTKPRSRRQLVEEARRAALDGDWATAIELNKEIINRYPRDADAHNRLGRAYLAFRRFSDAYEAYSGALKIDPANLIARRNLQRLEYLRRRGVEDGNGSEPVSAPLPRTSVFIEEVGKTWVDELKNPVPIEELAEIYSGEQLQLIVEGQRLIVARADGQRIGEIEQKTAERVIELMAGGNRYEIYALGLSSSSLRVILREVFRDPSQANRVSFPRQIAATRAYLRERDLLRQRDEADFLLLDEEEEELETEDAAVEVTEEEEEEDEGVEPDAEAFVDDAIAVDEEEEPTL
ncbi:MAG TPA: tetratricopeptide repeat protein [Thermomicrobiales bacterium]